MLSQPIIYLLLSISGMGIFLGVLAWLALFSPSRLSRVLGTVSVTCLGTPALAAPFVGRGWPPAELILFSVFFMVPGVLGIVFNGFLFENPGHCKTCGYNLTGNVSGRCSECGTAIAISE